MERLDTDKKTLLTSVIHAVEQVRRMHKDEDQDSWQRGVAEHLEQAASLLGGFGEGKALSQVVALCTEFLEWRDLHEVGVNPMSDPPWMVLQADLMAPACWSDGDRRARVLKILRKLSQKLARLAGADPGDADWVTIIDFCEERGVVADTLRSRLRRHNESAASGDRIRGKGFGENHRMLYDRPELLAFLTDEERARCP